MSEGVRGSDGGKGVEWDEAQTGRFSRVDRKRRRGREEAGVPKPEEESHSRAAFPLADRCICQSVADVSGSFHVVTRHVVIIVHFYLAQSRRVPVTTSIRNVMLVHAVICMFDKCDFFRV